MDTMIELSMALIVVAVLALTGKAMMDLNDGRVLEAVQSIQGVK